MRPSSELWNLWAVWQELRYGDENQMVKAVPDPVVSVTRKDVTHQKDDGGHEHRFSTLPTKNPTLRPCYVACSGGPPPGSVFLYRLRRSLTGRRCQ